MLLDPSYQPASETHPLGICAFFPYTLSALVLHPYLLVTRLFN